MRLVYLDWVNQFTSNLMQLLNLRGRMAQLCLLPLALMAFSTLATAQEIFPDDYCVQSTDVFVGNVLDNDFSDLFMEGDPVVIFYEVPPCFQTNEAGEIFLAAASDPDLDCCGPHTFYYSVFVIMADGNQIDLGQTTVDVEIKCDKPNCGFIVLEDWLGDDPAGDGSNFGRCIPVCELSTSVISWPYNPTSSYTWNLDEPTDPGSNPAEILVHWGAAGSSWFELIVTDASGLETSHFFCVDILAAPPASFLTTGTSCLNGTMLFDNPDPYVADYIWDFGDGTVISDDNPTVSHVYTSPGTYTVSLTSTWPVYSAQGELLCCCSSYFETEVEVSDLPAPTIYCVSTLCEGDQATYTTDATNCAFYNWTVLDADGNPWPYTIPDPLVPSEISVTWGSGPQGTVMLQVDGCDDDYCDDPAVVTIPIISSISEVFGPDIVCANQAATYAVPKWLNVAYTWNVVGGTIIADNGHSIVVDWGAGPVGTVSVVYESEFLAGLDGHEPGDCAGEGSLDVSILPAYEIFNFQPQVCQNSTTSIGITTSPSDAYTWNVTPSVPFTVTPFGIDVDWTVPAGTYIITAEHFDGAYCNTLETTAVQVVSMGVPTLDGPLEICPSGTDIYVATASTPGNTLSWNITGGSPSFGSGSSITVTWDPIGPYAVTVTEFMSVSPWCSSTPVTLTPVEKELNLPLMITGTANCTNSIESYTLSPPQHPDAVITWTINTPTLGSIVAGQGTPTIDVQWNATPLPADLQVTVELCGESSTENMILPLVAPDEPSIQISGILCPGVSATLSTPGVFTSYSWSTGDTSPTTSISAGGLYSLTTVDGNGCEATDYFTAVEVDGPTADISTPNNTNICIDNPHTVTLVAFTEPNYEFTWYCGGVPVLGPGPVSNFTHPFQGTPGSWDYWVVVENTATGCIETSNTITVNEGDCAGGPGCTPISHTTEPFGNLGSPNCNEVSFGSTGTNWTPFEWMYGDGFVGSGPSPTHTYTEAGCYNVIVKGYVPSTTTGDCVVIDEVEVCVPLAAKFAYEIVDCREVDFTNLSTFLGAPYGTPINSVFWDFDGDGTSTSNNPTFTFPDSGPQVVTLTVTNSSGCTATYSITINLDSVGVPVITPSALVGCEGDAFTFSGFATNAVTYTWDFGDSSTLIGASGQHAYTADGTFTVTLTAEDAAGCTDQTTVSVLVHPAVPAGVITGDEVICGGELAHLVAPAGYAYLWSNGDTTQDIFVGGGTYSVVITDANNCSLELDPFTVTELPLPDALISGDLVICDNGCTDLSTPLVASATYTWYDGSGSMLQTGFSNVYSACDALGLPIDIYVEVIDANGCLNVSGTVTVELGISPVVAITNSGSGCAGEVQELTVAPVGAGESVIWSTGATTESILVSAAGTYTAYVTDDATGCTGTASYVVNPLPDLCSVPVGCYSDCDSTEVCALPGLGLYQWNLDDLPIPGETGPCITILVSGVYSLTITDPVTGCEATSGPLEMTIEPCGDCENVHVTSSPAPDTYSGCCHVISTDVNFNGVASMALFTSDADFNLDVSSIDPSLSLQTNTAGELRFENAVPGTPWPQGVLTNAFVFCLENIINAPQTVTVVWTDADGNVVCEETLHFDCPVEPDCIYILDDHVYCEDGLTFYEVTLCNPADNTFTIGWVELIEGTLGIDFVPGAIDLSGSPLAPGDCQTVTLQITGSWADGDEFCFSMVAHAENPADNPAADCCPLDEQHCINLPLCDPCSAVSVVNITEVQGSDCCYSIELTNGFSGTYFDAIQVVSQTAGVSFTVNNPVTSGWTTSGYTGTNVTFLPDAGFVPLGNAILPDICVETLESPTQEFLIQWMVGGEVVCDELITLTCDPPCGYISEEDIHCNSDGTWAVQLWVTNTSDFIVSEVVISFPVGSPLSVYGGTYPIGPLAPDATGGPLAFPIGAPAMEGDEVCFTVTLHEINIDGVYLTCCSFEHCIELPACDQTEPCPCDDAFFSLFDPGLQTSPISALTHTFSLAAAGGFDPNCDQASWDFGDGTSATADATQTVTHTYASEGNYLACVKVIRTMADGTRCGEKLCITVVVAPGAQGLEVFPNPSSGIFRTALPTGVSADALLELRDPMGRLIQTRYVDSAAELGEVEWDLRQAEPGMYMVSCTYRGHTWEARVMLVE